MIKYIGFALLLFTTSSLYSKELFYEHALVANLIAKYQTLKQSPGINPITPKVGDKCPQCNDPPGKCGVGKVGDDVICDTCLECNGDGIIDEKDLSQNYYQNDNNLTKNGIVTMYTNDGCIWCIKWEKEIMPKLIEAGWKIEKIYVTSGSVPKFNIYSKNKKYEHIGYMNLESFNKYIKQSKE